MTTKLKPIRILLEGQSTLALSTIDAHGIPHTTPLFFYADEDFHLYWFSSRTSQHSMNCAGNPHASVTIYHDTQAWRQIQGVQMHGDVTRIADRQQRKKISAAYAEKFHLAPALLLLMRRSGLYCFTPTWLRYLDNKKRFGYRFEIDLTT